MDNIKVKIDILIKLLDHSPVAYILLDEEMRVHYINESFLKLRQLTVEEVLGDKCYNISNGGQMCNNCAVNKSINENRNVFVSRKDIMPNGAVRFIDDYAVPIYDDGEGHKFILEIMIDRTAEKKMREKKYNDFDEMLAIFSALLEVKDTYTDEHSERVRSLSFKTAKKMNLPEKEIFDISVAARLHDIGKVNIPISIIGKPGKLVWEEFEIIKSHPVESYKLLEGLSSFKRMKNIVKYHHERIDGNGYPDGLKGEEIPLGARIVAIADAYDAMTSTRSYRKALSHEVAVAELKKYAGTQFDANVLDAFLDISFENEAREVFKLSGNMVSRKIKYTIDTEKSKFETNIMEKIDADILVKKVLENTPCGYMLTSPEKNVVFASDYFLKYMNVEKKEIGGSCYDFFDCKNKLTDGCSVDDCKRRRENSVNRHEKIINNKRKIYDSYGIPIDIEGAPYFLEVLIDRTEEALYERKRNSDFENLISILSHLVNTKIDADSEKIITKIEGLKSKLNDLINDFEAIEKDEY